MGFSAKTKMPKSDLLCFRQTFLQKHTTPAGSHSIQMSVTTAMLTTLALVLVTALCEGKRVVVVPLPFTSHTKYHTNVARELVKLGHQVWLTMPDYLVAKGVLDTTNITVVEYKSEAGNVEEISMKGLRDHYFQRKADDWLLLFDSIRHLTEGLLQNETFFQLMKTINPDLFVFDNLPFIYMLTIIPYRLGVPFSFLGSAFDPIRQRIPISPAVTPTVMLPFTDHMSFFQRVANTLLFAFFASYDHCVQLDAVARYAPEMPYVQIDRLTAKAEIWLVETDHILDYPNPSLPNVKLIGGTATGPANPLPPHFQSFMDDATEGVVIVSFGSYVLDIPKSISDKLLQVLLKLPMKSVFRSRLSLPSPDKIMTAKWLPQNDLLGHPNTKVFVSHCGKNGQYEALFHAVPVVCVPMFADQPYMARRAHTKGFAEILDLNTCTEEELLSTIMAVAFQPGYRQAVTRSSHLFKELYGVPRERAAWWLDHVMKYGGDYMRSAGQEIPLYQLMLLDVFFFLLGVLAVICTCSYCLVRGICKCVCRRAIKTKTD